MAARCAPRHRSAAAARTVRRCAKDSRRLTLSSERSESITMSAPGLLEHLELAESDVPGRLDPNVPPTHVGLDGPWRRHEIAAAEVRLARRDRPIAAPVVGHRHGEGQALVLIHVPAV